MCLTFNVQAIGCANKEMGSFTVVVFMLKVNAFYFKFCMSFHQVLFILDFLCVSLAVVISLFPCGNLAGSMAFIVLWHDIKKFVTWLFPQCLVFFIIITFIFTMFWFCLFSSIKISSRKKRVLVEGFILKINCEIWHARFRRKRVKTKQVEAKPLQPKQVEADHFNQSTRHICASSQVFHREQMVCQTYKNKPSSKKKP